MKRQLAGGLRTRPRRDAAPANFVPASTRGPGNSQTHGRECPLHVVGLRSESGPTRGSGCLPVALAASSTRPAR